jgi:hypothetical protein
MTQIARNLTDIEDGFLRGTRDSLQHAIWQFMSHYHAERNYQGLENRLLHPVPDTMPSQPVRQRRRLGVMLTTAIAPPPDQRRFCFWTQRLIPCWSPPGGVPFRLRFTSRAL